VSQVRRPLRLWPGLVAGLVLCARFLIPFVLPGAASVAVIGGLVGALAVLLWWLFFSRAPWSERLGAIALMVAALLVTSRAVDVSIATGMMGLMVPVVGAPFLCLTLVGWAAAVAYRPRPGGRRLLARSCSRAEDSRCCGRAASPAPAARISTGGGPRLLRNSCSRASTTSPPRSWPSREQMPPNRGSPPRQAPSQRRGRGKSQQQRRFRTPQPTMSLRSFQLTLVHLAAPSGRAFGGQIAMGSFTASGSRPIGRHRHPLHCGAGRSDRGGPRSR